MFICLNFDALFKGGCQPNASISQFTNQGKQKMNALIATRNDEYIAVLTNILTQLNATLINLMNSS